MDKVTFIHAADLHIGAPVRGFGSLTPEWAQRLMTAIPEAYDRVIDAAIAHGVDFVVLAGDIFDSSGASYGDYVHFFEGLKRLAAVGIPAYLVAGNHDPYTTWKRDLGQLPPNARMLGVGAPEFVLYERDSKPLCLIGGRSYYNQTWPADELIARGITRSEAVRALSSQNPDAAKAPFALGIIHTGLDVDRAKAPADADELLDPEVGIDYWACGHLHKRFVRPSDDNPCIVFPGCIQARDIKESGVRGCCLVSLEKGSAPAIEYIPTASVVLHTIEVDVTACRTLPDVSHLIQMRLFEENGRDRCAEMVVRVLLVGQTGLHEYLRKPNVLEELRKRISDSYPTFFCDELLDRTRPPRDRMAIEREGLFPSLVIRMACQQQKRLPDTIAYIQDEFVKRGIPVPSSLQRNAADFSAAAETLVLDLIEEESE